MLSRRLVLALVSPVVAYFLLASLSCELDAKDSKKTAEPQKMAETQKMAPRKCCMAGFHGCPTSREDGCICCGSKVTASFVNYDANTKQGHLRIAGIAEEVRFYVDVKEYPNLPKMLQNMKEGETGKFVLKLYMYEYDRPRTKGAKAHHFTKWAGKRFECEGIGDDANLQDRTFEFSQGWQISKTLNDVRTQLEEIVPMHAQERDVDNDYY